MAGGYSGQILKVDLSKNSVEKMPLDFEVARRFIGGRGLGEWYLWKVMEPGVDALSPESVFIVMAGPLTGLPQGRSTIVSKNPLTGGIAHTSAGGSFHPELKFAGYDGIIISGKAERPKYLYINDDNVEIRDAGHIWGMDTSETEERIREDLGDPFVRVICIGPAGENLVRFACVTTEYFCSYGRTGMGAVMGSKNLKAIAVRGTKGFPIEDLDALRKAHRKWDEFLRNAAKTNRSVRARFEEPYINDMFSEFGVYSVKNNQETWSPDAWKMGSYNLERHFWVRHWACFGCPIHDRQIGIVRSGAYAGTIEKGPGYEPSGMLGAVCGLFDPAAEMRMVELADGLGMDVVGLGRTVAFAMECYQRGILTKDDFGGIDLKWGDPEAMEKLIKKITYRDRIGDVFAEGVKRASERIKGSAKYALHVKGQEIIAQDWRASLHTAIGQATVNRGADHLQGTTKEEQFSAALVDSLDLCFYHSNFYGYYEHFPLYSKLLNYITGWDVTLEELMTIGERIWNLERCFNVREGFSRKDDAIPDRFFEEPVPSGPAKGSTLNREDFEKEISKYYRERGWEEETGIPSSKKLKELGLKDIDAELQKFLKR